MEYFIFANIFSNNLFTQKQKLKPKKFRKMPYQINTLSKCEKRKS